MPSKQVPQSWKNRVRNESPGILKGIQLHEEVDKEIETEYVFDVLVTLCY